MNICEFIDCEAGVGARLLLAHPYPWCALDEIGEYIRRLGIIYGGRGFIEARRGVWIAKSATVAATAALEPPLFIDEGAEIRHGAYLRGGVIVGKGAVVGNSSEVKCAILSDGVQLPHYNYVGNSVLGARAHLGAGAVISNLKSDKSTVFATLFGERIDTGRRKFGALVGDYVEVGCGSVLCPGTVVGKGSVIYPLSCVRGFVPTKSIYKGEGKIVKREGV